MRMCDIVSLHAGNDWYETYGSYGVIPTAHPPSLKNPQKVKQDYSDDGWHKGDSKAAKKQALADLFEIHKRLRRQIGKPEIAHVAPMPLYPSIFTWQ